MRLFSRKQGGFTLVEIMIVVAIIALIAAIAIPNLLRARHNANETAAIGNLKTLVDSMESFRANQSPTTYPGAGVVSGNVPVTGIGNLDDTVPPYIDGVLAGGTRQGYIFTYTVGPVRVVNIGGQAFNAYDTYTLIVNPVTPGITGTRGFFVDQSGVIRVAPVAPANVNSVPLE